jgi:hypothetical protein
VLTPSGLDTLDQAAPVHVASVRHHFIDRLPAEGLAALERVAVAVSAGRNPG